LLPNAFYPGQCSNIPKLTSTVFRKKTGKTERRRKSRENNDKGKEKEKRIGNLPRALDY